MRYLSAKDVAALHDVVINNHELQGLAMDKSLDAVFAQIANRIAFGLIEDIYGLAACYGCYIAVGHVFNDANKRTAMAALDMCLVINGIKLNYDAIEAGDMIIKAAQGIVDEKELAMWLRKLAYR